MPTGSGQVALLPGAGACVTRGRENRGLAAGGANAATRWRRLQAERDRGGDHQLVDPFAGGKRRDLVRRVRGRRGAGCCIMSPERLMTERMLAAVAQAGSSRNSSPSTRRIASRSGGRPFAPEYAQAGASCVDTLPGCADRRPDRDGGRRPPATISRQRHVRGATRSDHRHRFRPAQPLPWGVDAARAAGRNRSAGLRRYRSRKARHRASSIACRARRPRTWRRIAARSGRPPARWRIHAGMDSSEPAAKPRNRFMTEPGMVMVGDHRLRHGHRQAGHPLSSLHTDLPGSPEAYYSGNRPRRPGRRRRRRRCCCTGWTISACAGYFHRGSADRTTRPQAARA